jgi:outer membrane protein assembly factor BamB
VALYALGLATAPAQADWTTYHADGARSGVDQSSATPLPFAPAWAASGLSGPVWAEPLVWQGLVIVVTDNNDVYAFSEASGQQLWHVNAGPPVPASALPCGDVVPNVGITSTPVIDPTSGAVYVVADVRSGSSASHTLVAYNARTGAEIFNRNVDPPGSNPLNQLQREGLALDNGRILVGYGGNDGDCASYTGYLVSAPADNVGANAVYQVPTSKGGAIWSGGGAPGIDGAGNVYVPTGNGANGPGQAFDHGDTLEKLSAMATEVDYFAPASWAQDSANDADLGSVSPALLPGAMAYQGGKNGNGYLVSTANPGKIGGQLYSAPVCNSFGSDAYLNGVLYVACSSGVHALNIDFANHRFSPRWTGPSDANGPPIIAGNLVWVTSTSNSKLYGLDPGSGAVRVSQATPAMEHFVTPAASDGRLFLATGSTLNAYTVAAPLPASATAGPPSAAAPTAAASPPAGACRARLSLALRVPAGRRIVRVAVYLGRRRLLVRRGTALRHIFFLPPRSGRVALRVIEFPRHGRALRLTVGLRNCHRVTPPQRRRRHARTGRQRH